MRSRITTKEKLKIIKLFNNGLSLKEIAKFLDRDQSSIGRLLRRCGFTTSNYISDNMSRDIINQYNLGFSLNEIAKKFDLSTITIYNQCLKHNIKMRPIGNKLAIINNNFFEKYNQESAYMLGLFIADGSISSKKHKISLSLHKDDVYLVEKFKELLGANHKINFSRNMSQFTCQDKYLYNSIVKLGIPKDRKTYNLGRCSKLFEILDKKSLTKDLIRGFLDGDGSIYLSKSYYHKISFCGYSKEFLESIDEYICKNTRISKGYFLQKRNTWSLSYSGKQRIIKIINWIYYSDMKIFMQRKYDKAVKIINQIY